MQISFPRPNALALIATMLIALTAPALLADTVVLKNGDKLTGTAVKLDGGKLTFKTDYAGPIVITFDDVITLTTAQPLIWPTPKGNVTITGVERTASGLTLATVAGPQAADPTTLTVLRSPADEKTYEASLHPNWAHAWAGAANVSLALERGNADTATLGVGVTAVRTTLRDKTSLYYSSLYSENSNATPSTSANSNAGGIRYDHNLKPKVFAFGTGDFLADALQDLDLRSTIGGGLGYHVAKSPKQTLDVLAGVVWTHESYSASAASVAITNSFPALDLGEQYTRKVGATSLFTEQAYIFPDLDSLSQYQFTLNSTFSTKLGKMFNWATTVSDNYTSFPPVGTQSNDFVLTTGLGITLVRP